MMVPAVVGKTKCPVGDSSTSQHLEAADGAVGHVYVLADIDQASKRSGIQHDRSSRSLVARISTMIRDGYLSFSSVPSRFSSWEFNSSFLNALYVGVFATLLSYQLTALVLELVVGSKPRGLVRARDVHMVLLSRQVSPLSLLESIARADGVTRKRFLGHESVQGEIVRDEERVKKRTLVKLVLLVGVPGLINVAAVTLTLNNERSVTFREAGFGGVGVGANVDLKTTKTLRFSKQCVLFRQELPARHSVERVFRMCSVGTAERFLGTPGPTEASIVIIAGDTQAFVSINVLISNVMLSNVLTASVEVNQSISLVKTAFTAESMRALGDFSFSQLAEECGVRNVSRSQQASNVVRQQQDEDGNFLKLLAGCRVPVEKAGAARRRIAQEVADKVTLVETDELQLADVRAQDGSTSEFRSAADVVLLRHTRRNVGLPLLGVLGVAATCCSLLARVALGDEVAKSTADVVLRRVERGSASVSEFVRKTVHYDDCCTRIE